MSEKHGSIDTVLGLSRGDEAKGRFVAELVQEGAYGLVFRFNGADNAGHTATYRGAEVNTHQIPMGILFSGVRNLITKASYVNPVTLLSEMHALRDIGIPVNPDVVGVSDTAHVILPHHVYFDSMREGSEKKQGSTSKGISFVGAEKYERSGIRVEDLFGNKDKVEAAVINGIMRVNAARRAVGGEQYDAQQIWSEWFKIVSQIKPYIVDTTEEITAALSSGKDILAEGAQAFGLDIDHGTYPYVTSSHTTIGGILNSAGVGAQYIRDTYGVAKIHKSSVGAPTRIFPTLITDEHIAAAIRGKEGEIDSERGKSTGRPRDLGWIDLPEIRTAFRVNRGAGAQEMFLAKLDCAPRGGNEIRVATSYEYKGKVVLESPADSALKLAQCIPIYETLPTWQQDISEVRRFCDLPSEAQRLVSFIEDSLGVPITKVGVGPYQGQIINR